MWIISLQNFETTLMLVETKWVDCSLDGLVKWLMHSLCCYKDCG